MQGSRGGQSPGETGRMTVDEILARIREHTELEAETEHEVIEEIRSHLEEAVEAARARGLDERAALAEAATRLGVDDVGPALQAAHVGWGTADGVIAAALPVLCAVLLRWVVFSPDGSVAGWHEILERPVFWVVSLALLLVPLLRFSRWRYAVAGWAIFWVLSVVFAVWPALRW
jgi:hypothetical protein